MTSTQLPGSPLFNIISKLETHMDITKNKHQMMVMAMIILAFIFNKALKSENPNSHIKEKDFFKKMEERSYHLGKIAMHKSMQ